MKMSGTLMEEYELLGDSRYRSYISAVDKALKYFESTSEWADLISALGKLNKVLLSNVKYPIIPRRITISKRLAQCMHPALPSGVHLKALETYDIIFKCIGSNRLSQELFIYSAGLFPLLGNAAMNVKLSLLTIYETHFVPLEAKLRPGLNGFLIGVLPGLEEGSDYYDRTDQLLVTVCNSVEKSFFYGCIWRCIVSNPMIRLPAVTFIINHYNRRLSMEDQLYTIGTDIDTMVQGLCALLQDSSVLVQRSALDLLLLGFPIHSNQLVSSDIVQVVTSALTVVLRRDMSLNRRLFSWLMGDDGTFGSDDNKSSHEVDLDKDAGSSYFRQYSEALLLKSLQICFDNPQAVLSPSSISSNSDLWCYRLLISLLDRPEISSVILDDIMIDIFRSLYLACNLPTNQGEELSQKVIKDQSELKKAANMLFGTLEPSYLWEYSAKYFKISSQSAGAFEKPYKISPSCELVQRVGSGIPKLNELCVLVGFLLDVVSLETYLEAKTEHLPQLLCNIFNALSANCKAISTQDIYVALKLCSKLLSKIQPPLMNFDKDKSLGAADLPSADVSSCNSLYFEKGSDEISQRNAEMDDLSLNAEIRSIITACKEKYQDFVVTFLKDKVISNYSTSLSLYDSLILPKEETERDEQLKTVLQKSLTLKKKPPSSKEIILFKQNIENCRVTSNFNGAQVEPVLSDYFLSDAFEQLSLLLKELSSFPTFYTNSKQLYDKHMKSDQLSTIPDWLKLLISLVCFVSEEDFFFPATEALFDLILLSKTAELNNEINEVASTSPTSPSSGSKSVASTVVFVALTPAVSSSQIHFLCEETMLFDVAAEKLWKYVGDKRSYYCSYSTKLLQAVHNLSPPLSACETVICKSMSSQNEADQIEGQKKFCILWHLTRDMNVNISPSTLSRVFDRCLFLMLDNLGKETGPQKAISQAWLNHSLQRGDVARFLEPIILILLHPDSARVSVQHVSVHCPPKTLADSQSVQEKDVEAKVYAISSVSGQVIYHISDNRCVFSQPSKKILALTSVLSDENSKESKTVTHNSMFHDFELPSSHERGDLKMSISLFVNPFGSLSSLGSDSNLDASTFDLSLVKRLESNRKSSFDDDLEEAESTVPESSIESVVAAVMEDLVSQVAKVETPEKDFVSSGDFNLSDEYQQFVLPGKMNSVPELVGSNKMTQMTVHPLHTYILLYSQVYDSQKVLYALYSLKAIILTNPRIALCSMATTNVSDSLSLRGQQIQILLARHRKSVFGNDFHGELSAEATTMFRSNTFVEIIVAACLYHIRSHYPNLPHVTDVEVLGNRNVRLLCMEVLTLVFSELVGIVKDSGKSFASYLSDLLSRSKVQKTLLYCLASSVYDSQNVSSSSEDKNVTFTETIVEFNEICLKNNVSSNNDFQDTYQVHLLRLMATLIVLEDTVIGHTGLEKDGHPSSISKSADSTGEKKSGSGANTSAVSSKYQPGVPIPCQSMFLSAILTALRLEHHTHLHIHWLSLVTSALPFVGRWLPRLVMTVVKQLCVNLEKVALEFWAIPVQKSSDYSSSTDRIATPPDYLITIIEGLTTLCHYCLLECPAPVLSPLSQPSLPPIPTQPYAPGTTASQIISNLIHVFSATSSQSVISGRDIGSSYEPILSARNVLLSNFPNVLSSVSSIFCIVKELERQDCRSRWGILGTPKVVKQHILSFLSPISLTHGPSFLAATAVVWHENKSKKSEPSRKVIPLWSKKQLLIVELVAAIKVLPLETIVQVVRSVLKTPPKVSSKIRVSIEVSTLQFFLAYIQQTSGIHLIETWPSLLGLLRDGLQLSNPLVNFHLLAILHEFVQKSPLLEERKSQKDLQDIAHKLIEACSLVACDSLEQTTWLWRNLAVRPGPQSDISSVNEEGNPKEVLDNDAKSKSLPSLNNSQYSVQALSCLAEFLASVLDFVYVGEEKEKVVPLLSNIMHYVTPYLKNHSLNNLPSFRACCQLLANISGYQHTRKAWRKEAFELLLDPAFFQMNAVCMAHWRSVIDHLMTHDKTTFRDFLSRVSVAQSGSLNLFSSKEQEYEQRANLLKRLAFVIFCSETDQYEKYMPDIQERLTESLKMASVPAIQSNIFLCFRVLLVRMSPHHVTSLWPAIITEMVQIFTQMEYDLCAADNEEFSSHVKQMSSFDASWVTVRNCLNAQTHPSWLNLYLSVCKLLDMTIALPASVLPQFQMYRWAFIGDSPPLPSEFDSKPKNNTEGAEFVPHVVRLSDLLRKKNPSDEYLQFSPGQLLLTESKIHSIWNLQPFFNTLSNLTSQRFNSLNKSKAKNEKCIENYSNLAQTTSKSPRNASAYQENSSQTISEQIESILVTDFLEPFSE